MNTSKRPLMRNVRPDSHIQPLEARLLLYTASYIRGTADVQIVGDSTSEDLRVYVEGTWFYVADTKKTVYGFNRSTLGKVYVTLGAGNDKFTVESSVGVVNFEISGGTGDDTITTYTGRDMVYGNDGNDRITSGGGNDTVYGGSGNDSLRGGDSNDLLYDESGKDSVYGDNGDDFIYAFNGAVDADLYDGGSGRDAILYQSGGRGSGLRTVGVTITNDGVANDGAITSSSSASTEKDNVMPSIEVIRGTIFSDRITLTGAINNTVYGGLGNDSIRAGEGNDSVYGEDGNDTIHGDSGNDGIDGGGGNDYLYGNSGNDTLVGGSGYDRLYGGDNDDVLSAIDGITTEILDGGTGTDTGIGDKTLISSFPTLRYRTLEQLLSIENILL